MSITSILCRMKVNHPVTRLPVAMLLLDDCIIHDARAQVWDIAGRVINCNIEHFMLTYYTFQMGKEKRKFSGVEKLEALYQFKC